MRLHLAALAIVAVSGIQREPGTATYDAPAYLSELDRVRAAFSAAASAAEAHALAAAVPDRWWVTIGSQVVVVDTRWLDDEAADALASRRPWTSVQRAVDLRLATISSEASAEIAAGGGAARAVLDAVLARPEFARSGTSRWIEAQRDRVAAWLNRMLERLAGAGVSNRRLAVVFAWALGILTLAALTWWLAVTLTRRSGAAVLDLGDAAVARTAAREWARRAREAARAGDLRAAVRYGYLAALSRLGEQGDWALDESRTPREYLSLLRAADPRHPPLRDLTRRFEQIWYGHRPATADDVQQVSAHLESLGCARDSDRAS